MSLPTTPTKEPAASVLIRKSVGELLESFMDGELLNVGA
jgi:hypothetical protein